MTIETIYQDALLAAAAYADWSAGGNPDDVLRQKGFTEEQIAQFKEDYTENGEVEYFDDSFANGFAAVAEKGDASIFKAHRRLLCQGRQEYWCQIARTI